MLRQAHRGKRQRGWINIQKTPPAYGTMYGHAEKSAIFLALMELQNTSHPDDASEPRTDDVSRKRRKTGKVSVGGRL